MWSIPDFMPASDAGIAGLVLLSGLYDMVTAPNSELKIAYFGDDEANYLSGSTLQGLAMTKIPLLLVLTEMDPPEFQRQTLVLLNQYLKHHQPHAVLRAYDRAQPPLVHDAPEYPGRVPG